MEDLIGLAAVVLLFGGGTAFLISISPVGKAIGDRIRGGRQMLPDGAMEKIQESQMALLDELDAMRQELTDVQERLDFAERLLVKQREMGRLPKAGGIEQ